MANFPQLTEEDFHKFDAALNELLAKSEASMVLIVEKAGHLIHQCGKSSGSSDLLATLAANSFAATQFMASLSDEPNFTGMFQQGDKISTLIMNIEEHCILVILFSSKLSVGLVKHYAASTIQLVAEQLQIAQQRAPGVVFDLTDLNVTDAGAMFRKMDSPSAVPAETLPAPTETLPAPTETLPVPAESLPAVAGPAEIPQPAGTPTEVPVICQKRPIVKTVLPGTYWWCACGRSKNQPYCDGAHHGTSFSPLKVEIAETRQITWCACKHSKNPPYCDFTHKNLP